MKLALLSLILFCYSYACTNKDTTSASADGIGCINLEYLQPDRFNLFTSYSISGKISFTNDSRILLQNFTMAVENTEIYNFEIRFYARTNDLASFQPATGPGSASQAGSGSLTDLDLKTLAAGKYAALGDHLYTFALQSEIVSYNNPFELNDMILEPIIQLKKYVEILVVIFEQSGKSLNAQPFAFQKASVTNISPGIQSLPFNRDRWFLGDKLQPNPARNTRTDNIVPKYSAVSVSSITAYASPESTTASVPKYTVTNEIKSHETTKPYHTTTEYLNISEPISRPIYPEIVAAIVLSVLSFIVIVAVGWHFYRRQTSRRNILPTSSVENLVKLDGK